ncbi:MFS transporter [Emericellopsis cladophorae]|uniref:MFS transporter n=1 Tax=Emericellopsis cladophorae TaxID=2686198 RepID=A0A9P9XYS9_9HYPO|nr:MFS transporter [Emericellopsis cladophorae]KAI6780121.1 MFS transporter [Emericellopsis cladophorae]
MVAHESVATPADDTPQSPHDHALDHDSNNQGENQGEILANAASHGSSIWVAQTMSFPREAIFVTVVCMAQFLTQSAYLGTLVLLRPIGESFGITSPPRLAWLVGGYSLTVGTFILFSGRLGDIFGYKRMLILGYAWFSLWSVVAGLSVYSNYTLAVFARVLQGMGPAICLPNALAIFGATYPPGHRKAMVFAFFGAVAPIGAVLGGVFGSLLALAWWPWANWAMAIVLAVLAVIAAWAVPPCPGARVLPTGLRAWCATLDVPGALAGVVALVLFNFAWTQAPISGWGTATVLVPLVLGLALFGVFALVEFKHAARPLLPFSAVNSDVAFVLGAVACGWATFGIWTLYLVQILQNVRGLSPLLTVAWFSPVTVAGACAAIVTGKLLGPWQVRPALVMTMALAAFTTGVALTAFAPVDQVYWGQIFVSMLVMPFGMDMSFPAATLILSDAVGRKHQGIGASLVNTCVNYGIALGVGFAGTVDSQVHGPEDTKAGMLKGFRGGLYIGLGTAGLGLAICLVFLFKKSRPALKRGGESGEKA